MLSPGKPAPLMIMATSCKTKPLWMRRYLKMPEAQVTEWCSSKGLRLIRGERAGTSGVGAGNLPGPNKVRIPKDPQRDPGYNGGIRAYGRHGVVCRDDGRD